MTFVTRYTRRHCLPSGRTIVKLLLALMMLYCAFVVYRLLPTFVMHARNSSMHSSGSAMQPPGSVMHPAGSVIHPTDSVMHPPENITHQPDYVISDVHMVNKSYFKLRREIVSPQDFDFIIENPNVCDNHADLFLIVLSLSIQPKLKDRQMIRDTWGSFPNVSMKLMFLFGRAGDDSQNVLLQKEHEKYGDIIQADFVESYQNLSYKVLMGLRWVSLHCRHVEYVLKSDMDMFVNIPLLIDMLKVTPHGPNGTIYGAPNRINTVFRTGKWAMPYELYPFRRYPPYIGGTSYVISGNIVTSLYTASQHFPPLNIEDVLITGCLRLAIGAKYKAVHRFARWKHRVSKPCEFIRGKNITGHNVDRRLMHEIWIKLQDYPLSCQP